jgi:type II secretory pathway component GspD/PulD (secretin)
MTPTDPRTTRGLLATRLAGSLMALLAMGGFAVAAAQELQVIELRHRLAEQVLPALQPLVEPGGVITGTDSMLFVRTSAANLEQIRQAVAVLDRRPRQLRVTVGQGSAAAEVDSAVRGSASVGGGDVQVGVNRPPAGETGVSVAARHAARDAGLRNVSSVTTLEGTETFIAAGQSAPVTTTQVRPGWPGPGVVQTTEYRDANTGFYATPRVSGDVVTLDLSPTQQRFSGPPSDRRIATAGVTTQVSGRLGEWISVGGANSTGRSETGGLLTRGSASSAASYSVWVKVEEVP